MTTDSDNPIRHRILDAAMALVQSAGLKQLGQSRVARAAGVPQGHLTYYFPKKIDLLSAIARRFAESLFKELGTELADALADAHKPAARARLLGLVTRLVTDKERTRTLLALMVEADADATLKTALADNASMVAQVLAQGLGRKPDDELVQIAQAALWGLALQHLLFSKKREETQGLVKRLSTLIESQEVMMLSSLPLSFGAAVLAYAAFFVLRTLVVAGSASLLVQHTQNGRRRRVYRRAFAPRQWQRELGAGVVVIAFDAVVLSLVGVLELAPLAAPTLANTALGFAAFFVWLEIWFYGTHRLLHTRPLYALHAQHHTAKVTHPFTSVSFSLAERAILQLGVVGFAMVVSRLLPLSATAVGLYFGFNYLLNVIGHSNVEIVPWASRLVLTPTFHAMHHARHDGHYGLFTQGLDCCFGTTFADYPAMHARARAGDGPTRLSERAQL